MTKAASRNHTVLKLAVEHCFTELGKAQDILELFRLIPLFNTSDQFIFRTRGLCLLGHTYVMNKIKKGNKIRACLHRVQLYIPISGT